MRTRQGYQLPSHSALLPYSTADGRSFLLMTSTLWLLPWIHMRQCLVACLCMYSETHIEFTGYPLSDNIMKPVLAALTIWIQAQTPNMTAATHSRRPIPHPRAYHPLVPALWSLRISPLRQIKRKC